MQQGRDPASIVGTTGSFINFTRNFVDTVKGIGGSFIFNTPVVDENGDVVERNPGSASGATRLAERFGDLVSVPEGLIPEEVARYKSAIMQMAYADARMQEGGNRLSDQDIRNALQRLGTDQGDPRRVATVLVENLSRRAESLRGRVNMYKGIGEGIPGFSGRAALRNVFGTEDPLGKIDANVRGVAELFERTMAQPEGGRDPVTGEPLQREQGSSDPGVNEEELRSLIEGLPEL
jgi:hypothetical protein